MGGKLRLPGATFLPSSSQVLLSSYPSQWPASLCGRGTLHPQGLTMGRGACPGGYTSMFLSSMLHMASHGCTRESNDMCIFLWGSEARQVRDQDGTQYSECPKSGICPCLTQAELGLTLPEPNLGLFIKPARQRHLPSTMQTPLLAVALLPSTAVSHSNHLHPSPL